MHWAADRTFANEQNVSTEAADLLGDLASIIERFRALKRVEQGVFYQCVSFTAPTFRQTLTTADDLDVVLIDALVKDNRTGAGRTRGDDPATVALMDAFLDDWRRHTGRRHTLGTKAGSARHFYTSVVQEMERSPPNGPENSIQFHAARLLPELRRTLDAPLEKALRSVAPKRLDTE